MKIIRNIKALKWNYQKVMSREPRGSGLCGSYKLPEGDWKAQTGSSFLNQFSSVFHANVVKEVKN